MRKYRFFKEVKVHLPTSGTILAGTICIVIVTMMVIRSVHPFLACNDPIDASVLIAEGWLPDYCLEEVARIAIRTHCTTIFTTGGPLEHGSFLQEYKTYAELSAATLRKLVPDSIAVVAVPSVFVKKDRTWTSALYFRYWIDSTGNHVSRGNLCSQATHTRRSRLFFRRALKNRDIGSFALEDREYDAGCWWAASSGVRSVIDELVAYLYALFFIYLSGDL